MNHPIKGLIASAMLCLTLSLSSFGQEYEYATIIQFKSALHISGSNMEYSSTKIPTAHHFDYQGLFKRVAEFEAEGWEIQRQQIDAAAYPSMTIWMRRKL